MIAAICGGVRVVSIYAPNGRTVGSPFYQRQARLVRAPATVAASRRAGTDEPLVVGGDFNVAPDDADVWDPARCHGGTHVSPPERQAFADLLRLGPRRRLPAAARRARALHLVGLPRRHLPQELRHAHRSPAGDAARRRTRRVGGDRSRGAQGQADPVRPRAAGHRPRRAGARVRRGLGRRRRAHRRAPRALRPPRRRATPRCEWCRQRRERRRRRSMTRPASRSGATAVGERVPWASIASSRPTRCRRCRRPCRSRSFHPCRSRSNRRRLARRPYRPARRHCRFQSSRRRRWFRRCR